ncbi:MAG: aminotransferase class V-fold PLP-dependent enzyme [Kordiimonadaceae bacterium]|jgi:cysteine desulfurase / selenocysteine lyase|nr:aminotransferase class V-fold PLP-dependent enzyme [Kordiimonadaceae bacterium]MBT6030965.1 aminotransferase class V-fold PLP-dependent enzyme [Kordiimonadaceae bacterium]
MINQDDFPITRDCAYLNAANVSLMPAPAAKVMTDWQTDVALNGSNNFNDLAEDTAFDGLRVQGARLFNCHENDIAGGSSCTELLSSIAWAVMPKAHENIVSTDIVFPSTIYPWTRVSHHTGCEIRLAKGQNGYAHIDELIKCIDHNTAVISLSHVEYTGGQLYDIQKLADVAHEHNALLVVDATQSAGAIPIDGPKSGADVIISGSYKWLCGPFGAAVMYLAPHLQNTLEPGFVGFRSHSDMWTLSPERLDYPETAKRFESSTMAFGCIKGLEHSMKYLLDLGIDNIQNHNMKLADQLIDGLNSLDINIISPINRAERTSIVTCQVDGHDPADIVEKLKQRNIIAHKRQNYIRFAPHVYNNPSHIDQAIQSLASILK